MKLSELVALKTSLDQMSSHGARTETGLELGKILHLVESQKFRVNTSLEDLQSKQSHVMQSFDQFEQSLDLLKVQVKQLIEIEEKEWFQESYRLYEEEMRNEHHDYILNRRPQIKPETTLRTRLTNHADWRYPAMVIRPGLEDFITEMVGYDPLYIVDLNRHLLGKVPYRFPPEYQNRLRPYVVDESLDHEILKQIPDNQFGMCLVYNFFNFRPLEYIKKYLAEIYTKLRPGGVLIMTYNDCDRVPGVILAEQRYACYTPGTLVTQLAENIGYDRAFTWNDGGPMTFLEIRKPGDLVSMRGGQALARPLPRPPMTPAEELANLRKRAIDLKLDTPDKIRYGYSLEKLRALIKHKK